LLNNYENTIYSDSLLPLGRLRESKKETSRADIIMTTKCPKMTPTEKIGINNQLNIAANQNSFFSSIIYNNWKPIYTSERISTNDKYHITLVTSVANADNLKLHLEENGHIVNHLRFPDHHNFTKTDIENILSEYYSITSDKNIILSTEKDKVKLTNFKTKFDGIKLFFIPINIKIDREQEFNNLITDYVTNHKRNC
jgi:tetraacyldisaccharide 4'-kinase